jgi:shikimate dehydrogenase/3-dehydroquinate dehydratase type I
MLAITCFSKLDLFFKKLKFLKNSKSIDLIEFRFDTFEENDFSKLDKYLKILKFSKKQNIKAIFTFRKSQAYDDEIRFSKFLDLIEKYTPDFVDIDLIDLDLINLDLINLDLVEKISEISPSTKIILSFHEFTKKEYSLSELEKKFEKLFANRGMFKKTKIFKFAITPKNSITALHLCLFAKQLKDQGINFIGISMQKEFSFSRVLGYFYNYINYATLDDFSKLGQIHLDVLVDRFKAARIAKEAKFYTLIGDPVDKSISDVTHNDNKILKDDVYLKIKLKKEELEKFFEIARKLNIFGGSITMPLKKEVLKYLRFNKPSINSCNTFYLKQNDDTKFYGASTDGLGAIKALLDKTTLNDKKVLILGFGGAAISILDESLKTSKIYISNRSKVNEKILTKYGASFVENKNIKSLDFDVVINATPLGMKGEFEHLLPVEENVSLKDKIVMDIVYNPVETRFLQKAKKDGASIIIDGLKMFENQANEQFDLWKSE